jgi:hypothetical protein
MALWAVPDAKRRKRFVDLQNDVTVADIALAAREGAYIVMGEGEVVLEGLRQLALRRPQRILVDPEAVALPAVEPACIARNRIVPVALHIIKNAAHGLGDVIPRATLLRIGAFEIPGHGLPVAN